MTTETPELDPCPYCGGNAEVWTYTDRGFERASVRCVDCNVRVYRSTEAEAAEAWNRRSVASAEPAVAVKALRWGRDHIRNKWHGHGVGQFRYEVTGTRWKASSDPGMMFHSDSEEEALADAQRHYDAMILAALASPSPSPVVSEEMIMRATVALINEFDGEFPYGEAKEIVELILTASLSLAPAGDHTSPATMGPEAFLPDPASLRDFTIEQMEEEIEWRRSHAPAEKE